MHFNSYSIVNIKELLGHFSQCVVEDSHTLLLLFYFFQMEWQLFRHFSSQSTAMRILSFGLSVKSTKKSGLHPGFHPEPRRYLTVILKLMLQKRYGYHYHCTTTNYTHILLTPYMVSGISDLLTYFFIQINIDHQTRDAIRQSVKTPNTSCFDVAQRIVYSLMEKDSYPRFLRSDIYSSLMASA